MAESAIPWRWIGRDGWRSAARAHGGDHDRGPGLDRVEHAWRNGFERHMA